MLMIFLRKPGGSQPSHLRTSRAALRTAGLGRFGWPLHIASWV